MAPSVIAATRRLNAIGGARKRTAKTIGMLMPAASSRRPIVMTEKTGASTRRFSGFGAPRRDYSSVAALALLEVEDRLEEVALAEVGPQRGSHPDLAVGDLPEQEVRDAHLPGRPNEKVGVRNAGR